MKTRFTEWLLVVALLVSPFLLTKSFSQEKPRDWTHWSKKEAEKLLQDSPWAKTQVDTNVTEMFYSPTSDARVTRNAPNSGARLEEGATNQEVNVTFNVRFFSARPIRQALVRLIELQNSLDQTAIERLHEYAELKPSDAVIVTVTFQSTDKRSLAKLTEIFNSASSSSLKNSTYLEMRDGRRIFLQQYVPPGADGFGARFIFPRNVDDHPYMTIESGEVRFSTEYSPNLRINTRFNISSMVYGGGLEY